MHWSVPLSSVAGSDVLAFILVGTTNSAAAIGHDQFRTLAQQASTQCIEIIATVSNHSSQPFPRAPALNSRHSHPRQRAFREPELRDLRGRKLRSDRYALAIDHHHALRTFPATGLADCGAPFSPSQRSRPERLPPSPGACGHPNAPAALAKPATTPLFFPSSQTPPAG